MSTFVPFALAMTVICSSPHGSVHKYEHNGEERLFILSKAEPGVDMYSKCGDNTLGCIWYRLLIYVPNDHTCSHVLHHELNHLFEYDEIDHE